MPAKKRSTPKNWIDEDEAPELTQAFFDSADLYEDKKIKSRGRPKSLVTKEPGNTRNWLPVGVVTLNPERDSVIRDYSADKPIQHLAA